MKKKVALSIGAMTIAAVLGLILVQSVFVSADPNLSVDEIEEKVTQQYPGTITEIELDDEGKKPIYEVEINIDGKEYELKIDGNSGEIIKLDKKLVANDKPGQMNVNRLKLAEDADDDDVEIAEKEAVKQAKEDVSVVEAPKQKANQNTESLKQESKSTSTPTPKQEQKPAVQEQKPAQKQATNEAPKQNNQSAKKSIISSNRAIEIALSQFPGKVDDVELDDDDGRLTYEIEIESNRGEAEIEIDAYTGKVLVVDIDLDDDNDDDDD